ncbi:MAG: hypothetical protein JWN06_2245 [Propionibacteriaceae bacterium]|jgi:hypothetical protein|nr:hypothetical protein [Propionibacteriaceae bacterium]
MPANATTMHHLRKLLVPIVALAVVGATAPAVSTAAPTESGGAPQPSGSGTSMVHVHSLGKATATEKAAQERRSLRLDASTIARQTKRSTDQVYADLVWQGVIGNEDQRLATQYPKTYAGLRILSHAKRTVWLGFTGVAPKVNLPSHTLATVASHQPLNETEMSQLTAEVARQATDSFNAESTVAADIVNGSIEVTVAKPKPTQADRVIRQLAADTVGTKSGSAQLKVVFDPRAKTKTEAASGGAKLETPGTESLDCTSAFSVIKDGVTGMLTAQHCTSWFTHENFDGDSELSAMSISSTIGVNGDLLWYDTPTNEMPQFRADFRDLRKLNTAPGVILGQWICQFGYGNGKSCDTVYRIGVSAGGINNLVALTHHFTTGGNSGGPWFNGNAGYGVHRGFTPIQFQDRSLFTPLNQVWPAFGASILLN